MAYAQEIARLQNQVQILEANARLNWNQNQNRGKKNEDWVNFRCFYCHEKVTIIMYYMPCNTGFRVTSFAIVKNYKKCDEEDNSEN